jgi:hypothetical protein
MKPERVGTPNPRTKKQKYFLSDEQRALLIAKYERGTIDWLAQELNVPACQVRKWARQLNISQHQPRWTEEDDRYLEAHYTQANHADLARLLGRTENSVRQRAVQISVNKRSAGYTQHALATALGVHDTTVARWIKRGWLKALPRNTQYKHDMLYITDNAVRAFIRVHPYEIDLSRVDHLWFIDLAFNIPIKRES